jgi:acrylyl-CoA reductase (NADPH)
MRPALDRHSALPYPDTKPYPEAHPMSRFKALIADRTDGNTSLQWGEMALSDLMPGNVLVRVSHTTLNYKDGLALTGKAPILRKFPIVPGIDFAGTVERSDHPLFKAGDDVVLNGWGVGETHSGGYAQYAQVNGDWLIARPQAFSRAQTMAIGTAGYTAMLAVLALEDHGIAPAAGPVLVTGAAGGVGSVAVALLARLGYHVMASTGRPQEAAFLTELGAREILDRAELAGTPRPLGKERWSAAIDVAGSATLANVIAQTRYGGCVAATGLAQGMDLPASVAPFILRGVTLAGIDSVMCPKPKRQRAWDRLARDVDRSILDRLTVTRKVEHVVALAPEIIAGRIRGRLVLEVG